MRARATTAAVVVAFQEIGIDSSDVPVRSWGFSIHASRDLARIRLVLPPVRGFVYAHGVRRTR
jgi:hypothetical protein